MAQFDTCNSHKTKHTKKGMYNKVFLLSAIYILVRYIQCCAVLCKLQHPPSWYLFACRFDGKDAILCNVEQGPWGISLPSRCYLDLTIDLSVAQELSVGSQQGIRCSIWNQRMLSICSEEVPWAILMGRKEYLVGKGKLLRECIFDDIVMAPRGIFHTLARRCHHRLDDGLYSMRKKT